MGIAHVSRARFIRKKEIHSCLCGAETYSAFSRKQWEFSTCKKCLDVIELEDWRGL